MKKYAAILVLFLIFIGWSNDPNQNTRITSSAANEYGSSIFISSNNIFITTYGPSFKAYKLDTYGNFVWPQAGFTVNSDTIGDGHGGVITADSETDDCYVFLRRYNSNRNMVWEKHYGGQNCTDSYFVYNKILPSKNDTILFVSAYYDYFVDCTTVEVYKLNALNGNEVWHTVIDYDIGTLTPNGLHSITDGTGGVIISYPFWGTGGYIARLDSAGTVVYKRDIIADGSNLPDFLVSDDSGGVIYTWNENGNQYAQKISASGSELWSAGGVNFYNSTAFDITTDGEGGIIAAWQTNSRIMGQRIDSSGTILWGSGGKYLYNQATVNSNSTYSPSISPDGHGGVILAWQDTRSGSGFDIYAQRINFNGNQLWSSSGVAVSTASGVQDISALEKLDSSTTGVLILDHRNGNWDVYVQTICNNGQLGYCGLQFEAVIDADRFGGIAPVTINFNGNDSYTSSGEITGYVWNFGDGTTGSGAEITHTYASTGTYTVTLTVTDNNGRKSTDTKKVRVLNSTDQVTVHMSVNPGTIKANGKESGIVTAIAYETNSSNIITSDLGLEFEVSSGSLAERNFNSSSGEYTLTLISGDEGTADIICSIEDVEKNSAQISYRWPQPPVNITVDWRTNRGLFRGEYNPYITWNPDPDDVYATYKYRIYRSTDDGEYQPVGEVLSWANTFQELGLSASYKYSYRVSKVDVAGDESELSESVGTE